MDKLYLAKARKLKIWMEFDNQRCFVNVPMLAKIYGFKSIHFKAIWEPKKIAVKFFRSISSTISLNSYDITSQIGMLVYPPETRLPRSPTTNNCNGVKLGNLTLKLKVTDTELQQPNLPNLYANACKRNYASTIGGFSALAISDILAD